MIREATHKPFLSLHIWYGHLSKDMITNYLTKLSIDIIHSISSTYNKDFLLVKLLGMMKKVVKFDLMPTNSHFL